MIGIGPFRDDLCHAAYVDLAAMRGDTHHDGEQRIDAGQLFNTRFLETLRADGRGALRFFE